MYALNGGNNEKNQQFYPKFGIRNTVQFFLLKQKEGNDYGGN